eukprot:6367257-Alexandrium_andersonii.AAC.1
MSSWTARIRARRQDTRRRFHSRDQAREFGPLVLELVDATGELDQVHTDLGSAYHIRGHWVEGWALGPALVLRAGVA